MASDRRIEETKGTFTGPTYSVVGDPVPTGFHTREGAEKRAEQLDTAAAIAEAYRSTRT